MTPAEALSDHRMMLQADGEIVIVRRYTGTGTTRPRFDAEVRGRVTGYQPHELVGSIVQGDRKVIVLAQDLLDRQFPLNLVKGDKAVVRGKELNIEAADDSTRRVAGVLIAYVLQVRG